MTTTYRLLVHCDENLTTRCYGLLSIEWGPDAGVAGFDLAQQQAGERGWLRAWREAGVGGTGSTYDVCPTCLVKIKEKTPPEPQPQPQKESAP